MTDPIVPNDFVIGLFIGPTHTVDGEVRPLTDAELAIYVLGLRTGNDGFTQARALCEQAREVEGTEVVDVRMKTEAGNIDLTWAEFDRYCDDGTLPAPAS